MAATKSARPKARPAKRTIAERMQVPPAYGKALVARQLAKVRALCAALPDSREQSSHGSPCFFVGKRGQFAAFLDNHHGDGRLALWCAAPPGMQAALVESDPDVYFVPPYVGHRGWIGVRLDRDAPWRQIAGVVEAAHQHRAAPRG